jgi:chaperonin GroEL (HSP60 family)
MIWELRIVEQIKVGDELMTYVRECKNPKSLTLLVRGATSHVMMKLQEQ